MLRKIHFAGKNKGGSGEGIWYTKGMNVTRAKDFLVKTAYWALWIALVYVAFRWLIPLLLPFFVALLLAAVVQPLARLIHTKLHLPKKFGAAVLVTLLYLLLMTLALLLSSELIDWLKNLAGYFEARVLPSVTALFDDLSVMMNEWSPEVQSFLRGMESGLVESLTAKVSTFSANAVAALMTGLPQTLLTVLFMIIATYFIALDYEPLGKGLARRMSAERYEKFSVGVRHFKDTILKYLRSYALIFLITFAQLTLGLLLCGVADFWLIALLIAVFDILPVVGSGMVMLPWSLIVLLRGDIPLGLGLMAVYLFVVVSRQFIEPRIVGRRVGLHPVVTLIAMFVGYRLFGGIGLIGLPVLIALLVSLNEEGVLRFFPVCRDIPDEEKPPRKDFRRFFRRKKDDEAALDTPSEPPSEEKAAK